jgi:hypothetical protein
VFKDIKVLQVQLVLLAQDLLGQVLKELQVPQVLKVLKVTKVTLVLVCKGFLVPKETRVTKDLLVALVPQDFKEIKEIKETEVQ